MPHGVDWMIVRHNPLSQTLQHMVVDRCYDCQDWCIGNSLGCGDDSCPGHWMSACHWNDMVMRAVTVSSASFPHGWVDGCAPSHPAVVKAFSVVWEPLHTSLVTLVVYKDADKRGVLPYQAQSQ